jgi:hypothetical protein
MELVLIDTLVCGVMYEGGIPLVLGGTGTPRMDGKHQLCEKCGERLNRVKQHRAYGPGRACNPRCKSVKRAIEDDALKQPSAVRSHKRARSDPGEQIILTATRTRPHRITAPKPPPPTSKLRISKPTIDVSSLLDQAHARRMALLATEQQRAASATGDTTTALNTSSVVWR